MVQVIHSIHFPVSARSFVVPIILELNKQGIPTELWLEKTPYNNDFIAPEITVKIVPCDLSFNPIKFWQKLNFFRLHLRNEKPRILHAHQTRASLIPLLAAYLEKVPLRIYHNHGLPYLGYQGFFRCLLQLLETININLSTHVLMVSHSNLNAAKDDGILPINKGLVLANGSAVGLDLSDYDLSYFNDRMRGQGRQKFSIPMNSFVLGYVGRPVRRKGFHILLKAWERSGLGKSGNILLIAGCTSNECDTALGYPVVGVQGLGYIKEMKEFYAACDAVSLPSEHEGFGYSLLEGAAAAKPLIGTDIPGIRCAIQDNHTGLLVPVKDDVALAEAINQLASNPLLRFRLGNNARERVETAFSQEIVLKELLDFYRGELGVG